jgi:hypothetical protein
MPAFDVTTNPPKLNPLKPGDKATIVVTATSRLARPVTGRVMSVVVPDSFQKMVKPPAVAQKLFNQAGATQEFAFTIEIPADAKTGSCTARFDVFDVDNKDDNFGQSTTYKIEWVEPVVVVEEKKKRPWLVWVIVAAVVVIAGIAAAIFWPRGHKMPDVAGMSFTAAKALLDPDSISIVRVDSLDPDTSKYKGDEVIRQDPAGGTKLKDDSNSVKLWVQRPFTVVPALIRQKPDVAANRLGLAGLASTGFASCTNDASFGGVVMNLSPQAGTLVARNSNVNVYVGAFQATTCPTRHRDVRIELGRTMVVAPGVVPR